MTDTNGHCNKKGGCAELASLDTRIQLALTKKISKVELDAIVTKLELRLASIHNLFWGLVVLILAQLFALAGLFLKALLERV